jgi:hypothetical protein
MPFLTCIWTAFNPLASICLHSLHPCYLLVITTRRGENIPQNIGYVEGNGVKWSKAEFQRMKGGTDASRSALTKA